MDKKKKIVINPADISVSPKGGVLYRGRDIRYELGFMLPGQANLGTNRVCINESVCAAVNTQCDNGSDTASAINAGFCSND
jgi:hypothetical protein